MRGPKLRTIPNPFAPALSAFTQPGVPTGGMRRYAPSKVLSYPLVRIEGDGIPTNHEFQKEGAPILRVVETNFTAPVAGGGVIAGEFYTHQPLVDPYDDGSPYIAPDGTMPQETRE